MCAAPLPQVRVGGVRPVFVQAVHPARTEREAAARVPAVLRRAQPRARPPQPTAHGQHHAR